MGMSAWESARDGRIPRAPGDCGNASRYPDITFSVRAGIGEELLRHVAQGEIDVAYCLRRTPPAGVEEMRSWAQPWVW
jgi:DNA-binding transcriptional LysR family regulator